MRKKAFIKYYDKNGCLKNEYFHTPKTVLNLNFVFLNFISHGFR